MELRCSKPGIQWRWAIKPDSSSSGLKLHVPFGIPMPVNDFTIVRHSTQASPFTVCRCNWAMRSRFQGVLFVYHGCCEK